MHLTKKIVGIIKIEISLTNKTGLLIRKPASGQLYRIGGADHCPMTTRKKYITDKGEIELEVPYIPGSSLKGRLRSLLELALGLKLYTTDYKIWSHVRSLQAMKDFKDFIDDVRQREVVCELFGWAATSYDQIREASSEEAQKSGEAEEGGSGGIDSSIVDELFEILAPTRLLVSDFFPSIDYITKNNIDSLQDFLEDKAENRIDRVTSAADPRDIVRVKPGVTFEGELTLLLFHHDDVMIERYVSTLLLGLDLLEKTYLGSSGSRGYGRVYVSKCRIGIYRVSPESLELRQTSMIECNNLSNLKEKRKELIEAILKGLWQ